MNDPGFADWQQELDRWKQRAEDITPVWNLIADDLMEFEEQVFASAGGALGVAWPPLSDRYLMWKMEQGLPQDILVKTGALKASVTRRGDPGQVLEIGPQKMRFSSRVKSPETGKNLGAIHQYGGETAIRRYFPESMDEVPDSRVQRWFKWIVEHVTGREYG